MISPGINKYHGFTLIEIILYVGLLAIISSSLTGLYIQILKSKSTALSIEEVNQSIRLAGNKIAYELRQADSLIGVGSSLSLKFADPSRNPTVFDLNNGRIRMSVGNTLAYITSNLVTISQFDLVNLSSGDSLTQNVRFTLVGNYLGHSASFTSSVEIRSQ